MRSSTIFRWALGLVLALVATAAGLPAMTLPLFIGDTTDTTDLDAAMKVIFEDAIVNNVVAEAELLNEFQDGGGIKTDTTTGGRYIETAQMFALPTGTGARSQGDYIPVPRGPVVENSRVNLKKVLGSVEMTAEVLKQVRTNEGAFVDWADRALPSLVEGLTHELDRMMLGYGSGVKARLNGIPGSNTLVVDSPLGIGTLAAKDALLQFLENEQIVAASAIGAGSVRSGATFVTDIDWDTNAIVVDDYTAIAGLADNDYLFSGDASGHSIEKEPMGLFGMVDDGGVLATFQNVVRADYGAWRSLVVDAQAAPFAANQTLTERVIMYADDQAYIRGKAKPDLFLASRQGARQYWADLIGDRSLNDPRSVTGGKAGVAIVLGDRQITMKTPRKMPSSVAFLLTKSSFRKWMLHNFEWDDTTGSIWKQVTDSNGRKDAFWAYGSLYCEFGNQDPRKNIRIENIYDSAF